MTAAPRRRYVLKLEMGADTLDDLIADVAHVSLRLAMDDMTVGGLGGPSSGYSYNFSVDESVTRESYFEAIEAWLNARKILEGENQPTNEGVNNDQA